MKRIDILLMQRFFSLETMTCFNLSVLLKKKDTGCGVQNDKNKKNHISKLAGDGGGVSVMLDVEKRK